MSEIPNGWQIVRLGSVVSHRKGYAFKSDLFQDSGAVPVIKVSNMTDFSVDLSDCVYVSNDVAETYKDYRLKANDVVLTTVGSRPPTFTSMVGKTIKIPQSAEGALLNQNAVKLTANSDIDSNLLYEILRTDRFIFGHIVNVATGNANQASISLKEIFAFKFPLPPPEEQRAIADILGTWDEAIALTESLIDALQERKKGLMQKLLTGEVRFPEFDGEWEEVRLGELGNVNSGGTPSTTNPDYWQGDILWCTPTEITALTSKYLAETSRTITSEGLKNSSAKLLKPRSILVCTRATIGEIAINTVPMTTNQGFKNLTLSDKHHPEFIYYALKFNKNELIRYSSGSTFLELSKRDFEKIRLQIPCKNEQLYISRVLETCDKELEDLANSIQKLQQQKKGLMQQLLMGQVRVKVEG